MVRRAEHFEKVPAPKIGAAYSLAWLATIGCWTACVVAALTANHPWSRLPLRPLAPVVLQAMAPLLLVSSIFKSLRGAANAAGWHRLSRMTYRRLNLGVAAASLWLAAATYFGGLFTGGVEQLGGLSTQFIRGVTGTHLAVALFCMLVWRYSVRPTTPNGAYIPRLARGVIGSVWGLVPHGSETSSPSSSGSASHLDDPDTMPGRDGRNEYALACVIFLAFAVMPSVVGFPLASVPSFLGPRLSRAASAFTFLAAVVAYVLKDASQRNRIHSGTTFGYLRRGFIAYSGLHLLLAAVSLSGFDVAQWAGQTVHPYVSKYVAFDPFVEYAYPNVAAAPRAAAISLFAHALALFAALNPLPKETPEKEAASTSAAGFRFPSIALPKMPKLSAPKLSLPKPSMPKLPSVSMPKLGAPKLPSMPKLSLPSLPRPSLPKIRVRGGKVTASVPVSDSLKIGDKVEWNGKAGTVKYVGDVQFGSGEWVGVELEGGGGMHNGSVLGVKYFSCKPGHGVFAQPAQLRSLAFS